MKHICKECNCEFTRGFVSHLLKSHSLLENEYYEKYYPRRDRLTGQKISFNNYEDYFESDFDSNENRDKWIRNASDYEAKDYLKKCLVNRINKKNLSYAPCYVDIQTTQSMPIYASYINRFGSYKSACEEIGIEPLFIDKLDTPKILKSDPIILIDTREQQPLVFANSKSQKLLIGDYTLAGDAYTYTFVDRKSEGDFKSTVTQGFERFCREIKKAEEYDVYIYIVVESSPHKIEFNNKFGAHIANMKYVWSNMRKIHHMFPRRVQFVFTGSRANSERLIPYLLKFGSHLWDIDVQYLLESKGVI